VCCRKPYRWRPPAALNAEEGLKDEAEEEEEAEEELANDNNVNLEKRLLGKDSEKAYAALKWDPVWSSGLVEIGWEDRFLGLMRKPLAKYSSDRVPFHR